ncbi:hypothetical protein SAMN05443543_107153 [Flavobacterium flevense]|nr:hypothetical protein SAMN05443543_107153 [Flavobacterium flevense]
MISALQKNGLTNKKLELMMRKITVIRFSNLKNGINLK